MEELVWCVLKYSGDADGYRVTALQSPVWLFANLPELAGGTEQGDEDHREEDLAKIIVITDIFENNITNGQSDEILIKTRVD